MTVTEPPEEDGEGDRWGLEDEILETLYRELHLIARREVDRGWRGGSAESIELVHEALIKFDRTRFHEGRDPDELLRVAPRVIANLLIDRARRRKAVKRGGGLRQVDLEDIDGEAVACGFVHSSAATSGPDGSSSGSGPVYSSPYDQSNPLDGIDLEGLQDALDELRDSYPEWARVVDEKFFSGLDFEQIAAMRGVPRTTVEYHWRKARAWLKGRLESD